MNSLHIHQRHITSASELKAKWLYQSKQFLADSQMQPPVECWAKIIKKKNSPLTPLYLLPVSFPNPQKLNSIHCWPWKQRFPTSSYGSFLLSFHSFQSLYGGPTLYQKQSWPGGSLAHSCPCTTLPSYRISVCSNPKGHEAHWSQESIATCSQSNVLKNANEIRKNM